MKIVHLGELTLDEKELREIPEEELSFIATLCFAVDEIAVFERLLVQTMNGLPKADEMLAMHSIQQLTILRVLNAKVFEALNIIGQYRKMLERLGYENASDFLAGRDDELERIKRHSAYALAKTIRDKSTNHYTPSETKKNLRHYPEGQRPKMYFHKNNGDSFHPIGEELVFFSMLSRKMGGKEQAMAGLDEWISWSLSSSKFLKSIQQDYLIWMFQERFPHWKLSKKAPYVEPKFSGLLREATLPLFLEAPSS